MKFILSNPDEFEQEYQKKWGKEENGVLERVNSKHYNIKYFTHGILYSISRYSNEETKEVDISEVFERTVLFEYPRYKGNKREIWERMAKTFDLEEIVEVNNEVTLKLKYLTVPEYLSKTKEDLIESANKWEEVGKLYDKYGQIDYPQKELETIVNDVVEQYIKDLEKDDVYILGLGRPEADISDIYLEKKEYKIGSESIIIKTKILAPNVDEMRNSNPRFPNNDITIQIHMIKKAQNRDEEEVAYLCKEINGWGWPAIYDKNNNRINTKHYFCEVGKRFYGTCNVKNEIVPYFNKTNIFLDKDSKGVPVKNFPRIIFNVLIKGLISQTTIDKITDSITSKIRFEINNEYWLDVDPPIEPIATIEEVRKEAEKKGWPFNEEEYLKYNSPRSSK